MVSVPNLILFAILGTTAGTLSGLFGIGGGMVIVPGLYYLFELIDLPNEGLMHMAAGTSMCIMMFTSLSSTWSHHRRGDVQWGIFKQVIPALGVGVVGGNLLGNHLQNTGLELLFGCFLLFASIKTLLDWQPPLDEPKTPSAPWPQLVGAIIGLKSGVLGIGGGAISVPFLLYCGLPMPQASGTSASFTFPIALVGTLSFLLFTHSYETVALATGYIYWPAVLLVAPFTMFGAPLGTYCSHLVPTQKLKRAFAIFLLLLGLRMLAGSLHLA